MRASKKRSRQNAARGWRRRSAKPRTEATTARHRMMVAPKMATTRHWVQETKATSAARLVVVPLQHEKQQQHQQQQQEDEGVHRPLVRNVSATATATAGTSGACLEAVGGGACLSRALAVAHRMTMRRVPHRAGAAAPRVAAVESRCRSKRL